MKRKTKTYCMHTIDGRPAFFAGNQICFVLRTRKPHKLAKDLKQIRREQKLTIKYRSEVLGIGEEPNKYSYIRVSV